MNEGQVKEAAELLKLRDFLSRVEKAQSSFLNGRIKLVSHSTGTPEHLLSPVESESVFNFLSSAVVDNLAELGVTPDEKEPKEDAA